MGSTQDAVTPAGAAVQVRGLRRTFGETTAVAGIDLDVPHGSFFGLVGPNGAGKTTLLSMITGLLRPDAGTAYVAGVDVWSHPVSAKALMGVVQDTPALFDRLTGHELMGFHGALRRLDPATVAERTDELLRVLDLLVDADRLVVDYSLGMTKKLALAAALLHAPRVLFLDEPFGAIDPVSTNVIEQLLHRFVAGGGTIVFSSHVMDVVERLCDRVAVIVRGRIVSTGTLAEVADGGDLRSAFFRLVGAREDVGLEELGWLGSSSD
ncbi:MAG TPA: ABC transporter ATP-binding protein [Gaiellales bacterium]|jgi:ABC-2 type transport system ATP-binding protein